MEKKKLSVLCVLVLFCAFMTGCDTSASRLLQDSADFTELAWDTLLDEMGIGNGYEFDGDDQDYLNIGDHDLDNASGYFDEYEDTEPEPALEEESGSSSVSNNTADDTSDYVSDSFTSLKDEYDYDTEDFAVEEEEDTSYEDPGYIFPDSDVYILTKSDLAGLTKEDLDIARNEIYARHGRKFKNAWLQEYFNKQSWYTPRYDPDDFPESLLNDTEKKNANFILKYEKEKGFL